MPPASYNVNDAGFHNQCPGKNYAQLTIVKAVFQLEGVRRAPGGTGRVHRFTEIINERRHNFYIQCNGSVSAWPSLMHIVVHLFSFLYEMLGHGTLV